MQEMEKMTTEGGYSNFEVELIGVRRRGEGKASNRGM